MGVSAAVRCRVIGPARISEAANVLLFNYFVGGYKQRLRHCDVEHPCRLGVDDELELGRTMGILAVA
jgi:hypothetical protein